MIKDLRRLPKEKNNVMFHRIATMFYERGFFNQSHIDQAVSSMEKSFDQVAQTAEASIGENSPFLFVKIVSGKVSTIAKVQGLLQFVQSNQETSRLVIVDDISFKPFKELIEGYPKVEVFRMREIFLDPFHHIYAPAVRVLTASEKEKFLHDMGIHVKELPRIEKVDAMARYLNLQVGDIIEIRRPSTTSGESLTFKRVIDCSWEKLF